MSRPDKNHVQVPPVFVWKAKNGSSVLAERTGGEYMAWTRPALEFNLKESLEALEAYDYDRMAVFYGVGNHGGGPTIENIRTIYEMREEYPDLELDFSTMEEFFSRVEPDRIPEVSREMGRIFYGCYSSDKKIKELNRKAEWSLQEAEHLGAMAMVLGRDGYRWPSEDAEHAWKETLFHQFHDVLAGTCIEPARDEACQGFAGAIAAGRKLIHNGIQAIANRMDTRGDGFPLILFNPSGAPYQGVFAAEVYVPRAQKKPLRLKNWKGEEIPFEETMYQNRTPESRKRILFEAEVPAFGYTVYRITAEGAENTGKEKPVYASDTELDNGILKIVFDEKTGCPKSIRKSGRELLEGSCGIHVYYDDRGAWGETVYQEKTAGGFEVRSSRVVEANSMRAVLRFLLTCGDSELRIDYALEKGSDCLKMNLRLRNAHKHRQISLDIPVLAKKPSVITETAFLAENKVNCHDENSEHYQHRFADISDEDGAGISVINDSVYAFRQVGSCYKLILLRNAMFARGGGGPAQETMENDFMNQGTFDYQLVWIAHENKAANRRLFEEADRLHLPVEYLGDSNHAGKEYRKRNSLYQADTRNVHVQTVKPAHDGSGDLVFRVIETEGQEGNICLKCRGYETEAALMPYEIRTLRLSRDGFRECNMLEETKEDLK